MLGMSFNAILVTMNMLYYFFKSNSIASPIVTSLVSYLLYRVNCSYILLILVPRILLFFKLLQALYGDRKGSLNNSESRSAMR